MSARAIPPRCVHSSWTYLADSTAIAEASRESGRGFTAFRTAEQVLELGWPDDVAGQWLYGHSDKGPFVRDHGYVDLSLVHSHLEALRAADIAAMPTDPSERDLIDELACGS